MLKEPRAHQKTRHIERRFNYIRDEVEKGKICIRKVHTDQNIADPLTKLLERPKHEGHVCGMGLRYSSDWIWLYIVLKTGNFNYLNKLSGYNISYNVPNLHV